MKKLLFSILALAMFWSCGKDDSSDTPPASSKPTISSFAPKTGPEGTEVTITGTNFSTTKADNTVKFGGTAATVSAATATQLKVVVPTGATTGKISVAVDGETATSTDSFTVSTETLNQAPEMTDQNFSILENHVAGESMGAIEAADADGDALTFELTENDNDLFAVFESGVLTLAEGKTLDYETATSHSITVSVTDGKESVEATITITVEDVNENMADDPNSFITTWETEADGEEIGFYISDYYEYNFTVDWGDGTIEAIDTTDTFPIDGAVVHTYASAGAYTVAVQGILPHIYIINGSKLMSIDQWGSIEWQSFFKTFSNGKNMMYNAEDVPDMSNVKSMQEMFLNAGAFNADLNGWNTSNVEIMLDVFRGATSFNGDISSWDTGNVIDMSRMFFGATSFNGDLSGWDTSNVTFMPAMFYEAASFDQSLGAWDISSVTSMADMLTNTAMSTDNYENTLIGWFVVDPDETQVPPNIKLGADGVTYCSPIGKNTLISQYGWTILDDGLDPNCP
ncbi:BspA family leucine-rich repeat surface protein [Muricauda brasiliensis]|uniref:BspA family leucine-rich repeat surface protein n=1 Tax=Muricauda brasiliensis TaxID=2162892 RepID=UPI000D361967|nr:BspA family leucine-rich repeat surface protein [Muricauda brasiliensis]